MCKRTIIIGAVLVATGVCIAADVASSNVELNTLPFFHGREYFVLRSGRAEMVVQADRADLGPAFTFVLFDAQNPSHSPRKAHAFNFDAAKGFASSALEVELGGQWFTALGQAMTTRWTMSDGIPCAEAVWWAGGIRVTERIAALHEAEAFTRSIQLDGANLGGPEQVRLRLSLPAAKCQQIGKVLIGTTGAAMAIAASGDLPVELHGEQACMLIGPVAVAPGTGPRIETVLVLQIPAGDTAELAKRCASLAGSGAAEERKSTAAKWSATSSIGVDDVVVRQIFEAAKFSLVGMIANDGTMNAGIFEYGAQWVRDTSNTVLGTIHCGHFELARRALNHVLTKMVSKQGVTMIAGGFDAPDLEQFDQMGELMHVLKAYRDWAGDDSLVREHREILLAMVERPLRREFRDDTGMVHNRREFWERSLSDAYELAYQMYVIQGLRDAADMAGTLGAEDRAAKWRSEADTILKAMLSHPTKALVNEGRLIKRRNVTGEVAIYSEFPGFVADTPASTEKRKLLMPDATQALPIALGLLDGRSDLARRTLDDLETLWNARWFDGGYDRYHTSGQPDQPGPWPFATCFIMRAQHDAGMLDRSRRSLEWLYTTQGGSKGAWFEEIPVIRSQRTSGILPWTSAEVALFVVRHWLGVRFEGDVVVIRPALYPNSPPVKADLRFRTGRLRIDIDGPGAAVGAIVNGAELKPTTDGAIRLPRDFAGGTITIKTRH